MLTSQNTQCARWQLAGICFLIAGSLLFDSATRPVAGADKTDANADKQLQADVDRLIELQKAAKGAATYDKETAAERIDLWREAADRGSPIGQFLLGRALDVGVAVAKDEKAAVEWYRKSGKQGYAPAQRNLGNCYLGSSAVEKDEKAGVEWLRKAAKQGWLFAFFSG